MPRLVVVLTYLIASLTLGGCMDRPEADSKTMDAGSTTVSEQRNPTDAAGSLDLPIGGGEATAFPIAPGSYLSGSFKIPRAATLRGIAVQIGNYGGSADGRLSVELCADDRCAAGEAPLAKSVDNANFDIPLSPALSVTSGMTLRYRVIKVDGQTPVAVWLYPPVDGSESAVANEAQLTKGTPRLSVRF